MRIYVSIVSHGHGEMISNNFDFSRVSSIDDVFIVIKDNAHEVALRDHCQNVGFYYVTTLGSMGFGENNNFVFDYCQKLLSMSPDDYFLLINPDVKISFDEFNRLLSILKMRPFQLFTVDLYRDDCFKEPEGSLRFFPSIASVLNLLVGRQVCKGYDKNKLGNFTKVDWASGAFLGFKSFFYKNLNGFDTKFFMYYEDVDICFRAKRDFNQGVCFLKDIKAVHEGAYQNRNVFSKHFRWYISSMFKFLLRKTFFGK